MTSKAWISILVFVLLVGLSSLCFPGYWMGGFLYPARYEIEFRDRQGRLLRGVQLQVESDNGDPAFERPVADYQPDAVPTSDERGIVTFNSQSFRFGGEVRYLFFCIPIRHYAPVFWCQFLYNGQRVFKVSYNELDRELSGKGLSHSDESPTLKKMVVLDLE
jgi:hypothetical protein